jgi:two-component system sensor histidine kinase KdpD
MPPELQRASADALLALSETPRGRLKVFLGAAPGVGKTYAMLSAARAEKEHGRDVVIGLIETHDRAETKALVDGIEVIPRKPTVYVNKILSEFDLDKALARKPRLLLVDELAHSNIPGSRHPKRWQDVVELLAAGIDVWTTLNVQHLEGLNDIVEKITRVKVRETVPDHVFEKADEIMMVDLPTEELLTRLAAGKVYVPDMADRARKRFFKAENLTALRELALRRAAERIDADLIDHMQAQAIAGPWAAGERILACLAGGDDGATVVRAAKRLADVMDAPWMAVTVERPGDQPSEPARRRLEDALKLAQSLGAETNTLAGADSVAELLRFAKFENVTQVVVGRSRESRLKDWFGRSFLRDLLRRADGIAVHVVTGSKDNSSKQRAGTAPETPARPMLALAPLPMLWSTVAVVVAVGVGFGLERLTDFPNLSMVFLLAVVFAALRFGVGPAVYASILSFLVYNLFFIEPVYSFTVARPDELLSLFVFLLIAVITATLAGRVRLQVQTAVDRMRSTRRLYEFTRRLSAVAGFEDIPQAAAAEIHASLGRPAVILLEHEGKLNVSGAWPGDVSLDTAAMTAAWWALDHGEAAGADTATLPAVPWLFLPLRAGQKAFGVIGAGRSFEGTRLDAEAQTLLETLAEQAAIALDRASLARDVGEVRSAAEAERVRNTFLASISHDFRTPLASILGSATSLIEFKDKIEPAARDALLGQIKEEAEGLDGMVRNLLAMTRIDAGALEVRRDWVDLRELAERAARNARRRGAAQSLAVNLPPELPLVRADAKLIEQALGNAVANAVAHTPASTHIVIDAKVTDGAVVLRVNDDGSGIAADMLPRVFDKFVHAKPDGAGAADKGEGSGLGLAIAKGIMEAHGGTIAAESPIANGRGTRISLSFPRGEGVA